MGTAAPRQPVRLGAVAFAALLAAGCARMPPAASGVPAPSPPPPAPASPAEEAAALPPATSRTLRIDLGGQGFRYFEDGRLVRNGPISAGSAEHPTPTGEYRVQSKERDKVSHSYTNYFDRPTPMPYSLQFHGPYFIHEGWLPGYPDSHGCVRLRYEDAHFLFERMKVGDAVVITGPERRQSTRAPERRAVASGSRRAGSWLSPGDPRLLW